MKYKSLRDCADDLARNNELIRIPFEVSGNLEAAEIHRRIHDKKGPAILFENISGSPFQAISNLYGTQERTAFIFKETLERVKKVIEIKADPTRVLKDPFRYIQAPFTALNALPKRSWFSKPVMYGQTTIDKLPLIKSWPMDGGAFVTLPQVYTEPLDAKGPMKANLGMYRIQLDGNNYEQNKEIGLHYQLHRGIGVHHTQYNESDKPFLASIFVGGLPSHAFSAIMPLPEGLSELTFAGMLGGRRFRYAYDDLNNFLSLDADFVITGEILKNVKKTEGPFGDHLGYYSLAHEFPVMKVHRVYHRKNPLWHFTVVGRPPQEDSYFGWLIHELVKELASQEFPGLVDIHAVDASGVHPLLLAVGRERYMPFRETKPEEILTIGNRILGSGQTSLAKYLFIAANNEAPNLNAHDIPRFLTHVLERVNFERDLHFITKTTIDTLDYSGSGWNEGSKVIIAAAGNPIRQLATQIPQGLALANGFENARLCLPGILAIKAPAVTGAQQAQATAELFCQELQLGNTEGLAMIVLCDDSNFCAQSLNNFLWVAFTRSNPSHDIYGLKPRVEHKHWSCNAPMVIDARKKPHHAPELVADPSIVKKVDSHFKKGGLLEKWG
jgi:4-hydroxy-3-polyprenylbenzoate decarboxylase